MVIRELEILCLVTGILAISGCGGIKPVTGGTVGALKVAGQLLSDIQVTVHRVEGTATEAVGFGTTDQEGLFELVTNEAQGPLVLDAGEYRFTLESAGAPVQFPEEYSKPETTPLTKVWGDGNGELELQVPTAVIQ